MTGQGIADMWHSPYFYCSEGFSHAQAAGTGYFLWLEVTVHHMIILGSLPYGVGLLKSGIIEAQEIDSICGLQIAAALGTGITWQKALHEWPQVLGKENPFNDQIEAIFKDQGGH